MASRVSRMVMRNLIARNHGLALNNSFFVSFSRGASPLRSYGAKALNFGGSADLFSARIVDEYGVMKRGAMNPQGSLGYGYWKTSFLSVRPQSTVAGKVATAVMEDDGGHLAAGVEEKNVAKEEKSGIAKPAEYDMEKLKEKGLVHSSYWGLSPTKATREDGSVWPWNCFMPWETYTSDLSIDLTKHHVPKTFLDKFAYYTVKALRFPTDVFFQRRYGCRAMMLETVAAVPGMVGGMLLHCKSLRKFQHSGGWIKALLEEAENERMHLMTFMEVAKPRWYERALVITVQGVFFNAYFLLYMISPKLAHRIVGYLEEEAIHSYTEFLKELDNGNIPNVPAPAIAIDYWKLPKDSTLRDVVMIVRADEAHHRDVNHFASDIHYQGRELKDAAAPLGYH
uniref:Ubiquinol oxidase n=1 Tax=Araucaria cunninghamii TaxID=56994 RepID=A0A0D6R2I8_ARACU